jgi:hypothetical protein
MPQPTITHSFYEAAPDMLLNKIVEVTEMLEKVKASQGETKSYLFWKGVLDIMKFSYQYILDTRWIHDRYQEIASMNNYYVRENTRLSTELQSYVAIRQAKVDGSFEEKLKFIDILIDLMKDEGLNQVLLAKIKEPKNEQ